MIGSWQDSDGWIPAWLPHRVSMWTTISSDHHISPLWKLSKVNSMSMTQELSGPSRKAKHQIKQFDSLFPGRLTALGPESKKYESGLEVTVSQSQIYFSPLRFPAGFFTVPLGSGFPAGFFTVFLDSGFPAGFFTVFLDSGLGVLDFVLFPGEPFIGFETSALDSALEQGRHQETWFWWDWFWFNWQCPMTRKGNHQATLPPDPAA